MVPAAPFSNLVLLAYHSIEAQLGFTTEHFVAHAHRHGLKVLPYTSNDPSDIARIRATGADGVFTDFPERVVG